MRTFILLSWDIIIFFYNVLSVLFESHLKKPGQCGGRWQRLIICQRVWRVKLHSVVWTRPFSGVMSQPRYTPQGARCAFSLPA